MQTTIKGPFKNNIYNLMRDCSYHFQREDSEANSTEYSFVRPRHGFPRFHIYARMQDGGLQINLHLDQKKPVYQGPTAHSGDYDEPVVAREMERVKRSIEKQES